MASFQLRRTRSGSGRWRAEVRRRGARLSATFTRLADAKAWASREEARIERERHLDTGPAARHTAADLNRSYEREVLSRKSDAMQVAQAPQLDWWGEQLGELRLDQVTPARLAACRDELLASGRSPATVNRYLSALSHALTVAVREWQWLDENPLQKVTRLTEPRGRVRMLDGDERRRLLEACEASPHPFLYPVVVLALSTGARKMQLLGLTWADVDLPRGRLILHQTKNRERRSVPLAGRAAEVVQQLARVRRIDTALLFPRPDGKAPIDIRYAWERALDAAGIDDFRFHDLRHCCASYLAMHGASLLEIAAVLGHKPWMAAEFCR